MSACKHDWEPAPELNSMKTIRYRCRGCKAIGYRAHRGIKPYTENKEKPMFTVRPAGDFWPSYSGAQERRQEDAKFGPWSPPERWRDRL